MGSAGIFLVSTSSLCHACNSKDGSVRDQAPPLCGTAREEVEVTVVGGRGGVVAAVDECESAGGHDQQDGGGRDQPGERTAVAGAGAARLGGG